VRRGTIWRACSARSAIRASQQGAYYRNASNINAGTLADARIPAGIARDNEVLGIVLAGDGASSTLDADLLDGKDSADFATASHNHDNRYFTESESDGRRPGFHQL
jgi:hypothetical protein